MENNIDKIALFKTKHFYSQDLSIDYYLDFYVYYERIQYIWKMGACSTAYKIINMVRNHDSERNIQSHKDILRLILTPSIHFSGEYREDFNVERYIRNLTADGYSILFKE